MSLPATYKAIVANNKEEVSLKELPLPKPSTDQVLVKVEFAPINPTDLYRIGGFYGKPAEGSFALNGSEGSGVVVAVGNDLKKPFKVGDRVHIEGLTWGQYALFESDQVSHILQNDLSFEDAASHLINPATVYWMGIIAEEGKHKAAIHTVASSALGRMLIRYYKHKGVKLINIVRREEYVEELKKEGADYVLNSQAPDFEERLKEIAEKENATLALEAVGGSFTNKIFKSQPAGSELLIYGILEGPEIFNIGIMELFKKKTIGSLFLPVYTEEVKRKGELDKFYDEVHQLLPTVFRSHVQKVFKIDDIKEAIAYYNDNSSKGKILIKPN